MWRVTFVVLEMVASLRFLACIFIERSKYVFIVKDHVQILSKFAPKKIVPYADFEQPILV